MVDFIMSRNYNFSLKVRFLNLKLNEKFYAVDKI